MHKPWNRTNKKRAENIFRLLNPDLDQEVHNADLFWKKNLQNVLFRVLFTYLFILKEKKTDFLTNKQNKLNKYQRWVDNWNTFWRICHFNLEIWIWILNILNMLDPNKMQCRGSGSIRNDSFQIHNRGIIQSCFQT